MSNSNWAAPQWLFDQLDAEFKFVLDAAASGKNAKCAIYFTKEDDALTKDWWPFKSIWCNPPYNQKDLNLFMAKAHAEGQKPCVVVCLLPAWTDRDWWHKYCREGEQRFIKGRLYFTNGDGVAHRAHFGSAIVIFSTWRILVRRFMEVMGGSAKLKDLYDVAANRLSGGNNNHVNAKIRQTLQRYADFARIEPGKWEIANV